VTEFTVSWSIDVEADTPEDAAREAQAIQRDPDSSATIFRVTPTNDPEGGEDIDVVRDALEVETLARWAAADKANRRFDLTEPQS
jgi:hypothetical protein